MISAKIVADSIGPNGHRITTMMVTFPRMILAELNTHRLFSRNSASSRAIPFKKMVESVQNNPFIPIAWQKDHSGMQGSEYFSSERGDNIHKLVEGWLQARDAAVQIAQGLHNNGVTKQICNRLLEPFMWHTVLVTATEWDNFFELRCSKYEYEHTSEDIGYFKTKNEWRTQWSHDTHDSCDMDNDDMEWFKINKGQSEIHMMALAEAMYDAYQESTPKQLKAGEWHIPFGDDIDEDKLYAAIGEPEGILEGDHHYYIDEAKIKIATARCARVSYTVVGEESKKHNYSKDIELHDRLLSSGHMSPFEHIARCMSDDEYNMFIKGRANGFDNPEDGIAGFDDNALGWCNNFRGFIQYRYILDIADLW